MNELQSWWRESPALLALIVNNGLNLLVAVLTLVIGALVARWVSNAIQRTLGKSSHFDSTLVPVLATVARWAILTFTLIAVLARFGVQTASLLAVLGAAGLAVGLALQGTLSNVASGIMLLFLRPFRVGEYIAIPAGAGTVQEISLFTTTLLSYDGIWQSVPNGTLWAASITNYSRGGRRMVELSLPLDYSTDVRQAMALVRDIVTKDRRVSGDPAPLIAIGDLTPTAIILLVRCWTERADFFPTKLDLQAEIKAACDEAGIAFTTLVTVKPAVAG